MGSPHIVILGPMGVGKTTLARALAERVGRPMRDSDADIEALVGLDGGTVARTESVAELHRLEAAVLLGALADTTPLVIAAAGAVVDDVACRRALQRRAFVVVLDADTDVVLERIASSGHRRAMSREELASLMARREPLLAELSDLRLNADEPPDALAAQVVTALR